MSTVDSINYIRKQTDIRLKVLTQFLAKSDGKDKLLATIQYLCLFISNGNAGLVKQVQMNLAGARRVFRIMKPFETIYPSLNGFSRSQSMVIQILNKLKALFMASYFTFDHLVWATSIGIVKVSKERQEKFQKTSLWSWFLGSLTTLVVALQQIQSQLEQRPPNNGNWTEEEKSKALKDMFNTTLVAIHASVQGLLAMGLLQLQPMKPRTVGFFGILASALNCYMMLPPVPQPQNKGKQA